MANRSKLDRLIDLCARAKELRDELELITGQIKKLTTADAVTVATQGDADVVTFVRKGKGRRGTTAKVGQLVDADLTDRIIALLTERPQADFSPIEVNESVNGKITSVQMALQRMVEQGRIKKVSHGKYASNMYTGNGA